MSANGTNGATNRVNDKNNHSHEDWTTNPRWSGITRSYSYADVLRLRGSIQIEYTLARLGAERFWNFPTLCWLNHSDGFLQFLCGGGCAMASTTADPGSALVALLIFATCVLQRRRFRSR